MPAEAGFSATVRSVKGDLFTIRGDDYDDFVVNAVAALGESAADFLSAFADTFAGPAVAPSVQQIASQFPGSTVVSGQVGGVAIPDNVVQMPQAAVPPPVGGGSCAHGPRVYKDSVARGESWKRWECAIPWSKTAQGRCKPVNV